MDDLYALLGVAPGASMEEVRRAARRLRAEVHPDRHGGALLPRAQEINAACDVLCDERRRAAYDASGRAEPDPFDGLVFATSASFAPCSDLSAPDWSGLFQ